MDKPWKKIAAGLLFVVAGAAGIVFGKTAKQRIVRVSLFILSGISISLGGYLLIDGTTDQAIGIVGQYKFGEETIQTMTFPGPNFFEMSLEPLKKQFPELRRLEYNCPDNSKSFTVYFTKIGYLGIPKSDVICADGTKLVQYDESKGYVVESR